jgi:tetratricopeptide (TPR) repeat protein
MRPGYAQAYVGLSTTYRRMNDEPKAIEVLERFLAEVESSDDAPKPVKGKVTASNSIIIPELSNGKTIGGQTVTINGTSSLSNEPRSKEDLQKNTDRLEQSKNTSLAYFTLADMYDEKGESEKALETVNRGLSLDDTDPYGFLVRGRIKVNLGALNAALKDADRAVDISQGIPHVYVERGLVYIMLGREKEAQADFDRFLKIIPGAKAGLEKRIETARSKRAQ